MIDLSESMSTVVLTIFFNVLKQGKITCSNVLSDLYALGVTECDNMLMLLAVAQKMTEKERDVVVPLILRGFKVSLVLVAGDMETGLAAVT